MISFITSAYVRTEMLRVCLATLIVQDDPKEIMVCDNSPDARHFLECDSMAGVNYWFTGDRCKSCYESANAIYGEVDDRCRWLCFPSEDSLYVQGFSRIMLETAERTGADLVYCDCIYRQDATAGNWPEYSLLKTEPRMGKIDKTCFILRRELFKGFRPHPRGYCDGALIEQLVAQGVRHAKAPGVLCIHQ